MMRHIYVWTPILAWLIAGLSKFFIHSFKAKKLAFQMIGYGGMPSTHAAIVSSMTTLIGLQKGIDDPCFGIALTLMLIVFIDANGLRNHIGNHAVVLNKLSGTQQLREKMGHSLLEIAAGFILGAIIGVFIGSVC